MSTLETLDAPQHEFAPHVVLVRRKAAAPLRKGGLENALPALLLVWWSVHIAQQIYLRSADTFHAASATASGSLLNQSQVLAFAAIGAPFVPVAWNRMTAKKTSWTYVLLAYILWASLSTLWSNAGDIALRRLSEFILICIGSIGVGGFYARLDHGATRLLEHITLAGLIAAGLAIPEILSDLNLTNILNPNWNPNVRQVGPELLYAFSFSLIASVLPILRPVRRRNQMTRIAPWVTSFVLLCSLLLTKSRSNITYTLVIWLAIYFAARKKSQEFVTIVLLLAAVFIPLSSFMSGKLESSAWQFFARGDDAHTISQLDGRLPLWDFVMNDISLRPLTGVGFGSYWTTSKLFHVWSRIHWNAPLAHNGYLDELVATGAIGLALINLLLLLAIVTLKKTRRSENTLPAYVAIGFITLFIAVNFTDSILQFYFKCPFFISLAMLTCCSVLPNQSRYRSKVRTTAAGCR